jgi:hypothetical protein
LIFLRREVAASSEVHNPKEEHKMLVTLRISKAGVTALAAVILVTGCNSGSKQTEAKLEEMQKQLDETKKQLEASKEAAQAAAETASQAAAKTVEASKSAAQQTAAAGKTPAPASKNATSKAAAENRENIAANKERIDANKAAIAQNKSDIQENTARVERAQGTADEAKRMAAPAPYHTLAAGTPISVRTTGLITTKSSSTGSIFEATLVEPLVIDGYTVAGKGATVEGVVTNSDPGGRVKGVASIALGLRSVMMEDGRRLPIRTSTVSEDAKKSGKKDAVKVGIASGIGAAIGAIAGGGKGAAIGAGAGAAGGTGMALATRGEAAEIAAESVLNFTLSAPVKLQELKK